MSVFGDYAKYYNLLYKDKNYTEEVSYILSTVDKFFPSAKTALDIGCGTGKHAYLMCEKGLRTSGMDRSESMLENARRNFPDLDFYCNDFCSFNLNRTFDVVTSLFHVVSYLSSNALVLQAFTNVSKHLSKQGLFIFDCWYGPAVLSERPVVRIKRFGDKDVSVIRIAEPIVHANDNVVDVHYKILEIDNSTSFVKQLDEVHRMRYFFHPEIHFFLELTGFKLLHSEEWVSSEKPGEKTWGVCFIAQKKV